MRKHTPRPWSLTAARGAHIVVDSEGNEIHVGTNEANARLIAAAPDLLEACEAIDTFFVFFESWTPPDLGSGARQALDTVKTALAKATKEN